MPNFIIVGAQKSGTTALARYLQQHPQIYMSPVKEPGFFDFEGLEPNFCGPGDAEWYRYPNIVNDIDSYCKLFAGVSTETAIGEATTWYLYSPRAPERIQHYIPDVKLIAILRNPVDRAYSAFMHTVYEEREPLRDFAKALKEEEKRIANNWEYRWRYKQMGFYSAQLKRYFDLFDRSQIRVYLYEDLNENPIGLLNDIFQFLNVDIDFIPDVTSRHNASGIVKSRALHKLVYDDNPIKNAVKSILPGDFRKKIVAQLKIQNLAKIPCPSDVRRKLLEDFCKEVSELQSLIHRDLSEWLLE